MKNQDLKVTAWEELMTMSSALSRILENTGGGKLPDRAEQEDIQQQLIVIIGVIGRFSTSLAEGTIHE